MEIFVFFALTRMMVSEEELRFAAMYKQGYDTSCGIAVTASLLNHYWNTPVTEPDLYQTMILDRFDGEAAAYTITFYDIMQYMETRQIAARAYKMDWNTLGDSLEKGYAPIIIHYEKPRPHFALLLRLLDNYALAADPAKGFEIVDKTTFEKNYSGNALLTASRDIQKNTGLIEQIASEKIQRLHTLQDLARSRRRW
jgi:ABC-type bacteriocin/lantibiotic exporter with double-glycine peptidase domain